MKVLTLTENNKTVMTFVVRNVEFDGGTVLAEVDLNGAIPQREHRGTRRLKHKRGGRGPDRKPRRKSVGNVLTAKQVAHIKYLLNSTASSLPAGPGRSDYYRDLARLLIDSKYTPMLTFHTIRDINLKRSWKHVRAYRDPAGPVAPKTLGKK